MVTKLNKFFICGIALFLWGCTIDYATDSDPVTKSELIPDSEMQNFTLIQIKNNKPYTEIKSSKAAVYDKQNKTVLEDVEFYEYDKTDGNIITRGFANSIEFYNDTESAELKGDINFTSKTEDIEMTGDYLFWNKEEKTINSTPKDVIKVIKGDGSMIEGAGFRADLKRSEFSFSHGVTGITE